MNSIFLNMKKGDEYKVLQAALKRLKQKKLDYFDLSAITEALGQSECIEKIFLPDSYIPIDSYIPPDGSGYTFNPPF